MARSYKTDWQYDDVIPADDINRWEENMKEIDEENGTLIADRNVSDSNNPLIYRLKEFRDYYILTIMGTLLNDIEFSIGRKSSKEIIAFTKGGSYEGEEIEPLEQTVRIDISTSESSNVKISNVDSDRTVEGIYKKIMIPK